MTLRVKPDHIAVEHTNRERPLYSVIVPIGAGGDATILRCLDGLATKVCLADQFEVLLVDASASQEASACVEVWRESHPNLRVRCLAAPGLVLAAARNFGAEAADSEILLFTDADCVPSHRWAERPASAPSTTIVSSALRAPFAPIKPASCRVLSRRNTKIAMIGCVVWNRSTSLITTLRPIGATYFWRIGGFDAMILSGEDQELSFRLAEKGYRMVFVPEAVVTHVHGNQPR